MLVTKDINNKVFDYIYPGGDPQPYISREKRNSYLRSLNSTVVQSVFHIYMIFNFLSVIDWKVISAKNNKQVKIDDYHENNSQVINEYSSGNLVLVDMNSI